MKEYLTYLVFVPHNHLMTNITKFKLHILDHNIFTIVLLFYFNNKYNMMM